MPSRRESAARTILIGVGTTLLIAIGSAAWSAKEDVSAHAVDMARIDTRMQRILDVLCEDRPAARQCAP